jgi:hypothetical protein
METCNVIADRQTSAQIVGAILVDGSAYAEGNRRDHSRRSEVSIHYWAALVGAAIGPQK